MNFEDYSKEAIKTASTNGELLLSRLEAPHKLNLLHAALGMASEAGEVLEWAAAPSVLPESELVAELGDCLWFMNLAVHRYQFDLEHLVKVAAALADEYYEPEVIFENVDIASEMLSISAGTVCNLVKASIFYGRVIEPEFVLHAAGEYLAGIILCCRALKITLEEVMDKNIAKLRARYGEAFSEERANSRDLKKEQTAYTKE